MSERNARLSLEEGWRSLASGDAASATSLADAPGADPLAAGILRGLACYRSGKAQEAASHWKAVLAADAQNPVAALYLPLALFRTGERAAAAAALNDPELVILPHRGWLADFMELFWPLRATIHAEAPVQPPSPDPFSTDFNRWKAAIGALAGSPLPGGLRRSSDKLAARYHAAALRHYEAQRLHEAAPLFARAAEVAPHNEEYAVHAAFAALLQGRTEDAWSLIALFINAETTAEANAPLPHPDLLAVWAWVLHNRGEYRQSLQLIGCIHPEGPDDWGGHFHAAVNWLELGETARFRATLDHALTLYFIDTWEQLLRPFVTRTREWLRTE